MAVIKREAPDQRRHVRSATPLAVQIQGVSYTVKDWSLGGFRVDDFLGGDLNCNLVGARLFVQFTLPYQGLDVSFTTEVEVVRRSDDGRMISGRFVHLNPREKEVLGYAALGSARNGERASLIEALARIDIPVTPVSPVPTAKEAPPPRRTGVWLRRAFWSLFCWTIGLALGAVILLLLYFRFFRLDLEYSVVTLPLYPVISQDVARCKELYVKEGDVVKSGDKLLDVDEDMLTRDLEEARLQRDAAEVDCKTAKDRVEKERQTFDVYRTITTDKLESAQSLVAALTEQRGAQAAIVNRSLRLQPSGAATREDLEVAQQKLALLEGQLLQARSELKIAENARQALKQDVFYDQRRLVGDLPQLLVNLKDAEERYTLAQQRLRETEARAARLTYRAPFDGKVVKVLKVVGGTMNRGEAVLVLEKAEGQPVIDGFVTQDDANALTIGAQASVWVPALDRTFRGQIVKIDRTSGFLTEMQEHLKDSQLRYNWRGQSDRSAYVQLEITEDLPPEVKGQLAGGMPVTVSVARRPPLWHQLCALFGQ
jgi:multidrug resistance efflux pump